MTTTRFRASGEQLQSQSLRNKEREQIIKPEKGEEGAFNWSFKYQGTFRKSNIL